MASGLTALYAHWEKLLAGGFDKVDSTTYTEQKEQ